MVESFRMVLPTQTQPKPPVGTIESLTSGFETVASNVWLIALPAALDLFLWLGPHLSINPIAKRLVAVMRTVQPADAASAASQQAMIDFLGQAGQRGNMFTLLSTAPLGIPSLMVGQLPLVTPLGKPPLWFVDNEWLMLINAVTFLLLGLLLGAAYLSLIGLQLREPKLPAAQVAQRIAINWARLTAFGVLVVLAGAALSVPAIIVIGLLQAVSPLLGGVALSVWAAVMLWLFFYVVFSPHGMILRDRGLFGAMWDSVRLVQWNLFPVVGLYLVVFLLNWGLGYVWNLPAPDSWVTLAGIGGHAFVSTGLVTATFVFYKDRYRWWVEMRQWLPTIKAPANKMRG